ncbi:ATP-binding protein [Microvirga yunnanensis]|uniref:ATP-binding protein n=1 Tax=Microvirga yunnanensis TaxID=2953740 RepID=UPI0021C69F9C|nr:ATP-binding protein [Microvirga sp. HBU65207]
MARRWFGLEGAHRVLWVLFIVSLVLPVSLFGAAAWHSRTHALDEAYKAIERATLVLQGHAQKVFESYELVMDRVEDRVASMAAGDLRNSLELHHLLKDIIAQQKQIGSIWVVDQDGVLQSASGHYPVPQVSIADRPYMMAFRAGRRELMVGETLRGRVNGNDLFTVARPLVGPDGRLTGAILVAAYPSYFQDLYRRSAPDMDHAASLVRADGTILVRDAHTSTKAKAARAGDRFMEAVQTSPTGAYTGVSSNDGIERIIAYQKLDRYPIYVRYALGTDAVLAGWREQLIRYGLITLVIMAGLAAMTGLALARYRREQAATAQLAQETHRREEVEERLRRAQKMEALGQLTGGIAHDFNNLLAVVMGNLDLLRRAKDDERRSRLIGNALGAVEQARTLTGKLLVFARKQPLHAETVSLNEVIAQAEDMIVQSLRGDIRLELELAEQLWPVRIDPSQLQVALINMAANARDAMPKGGTFCVKTENTMLRDGEVLEGVALSLSDTGVGMPREVLARVFEPFFTTKEIGKGTGLGLAQVYGLVEHSGGSVDIRSEVGRGTTITLYLPKATADELAPAVQDSAPKPANPRALSILVVEDNVQVAEMAETVLTERGHSVSSSRSGDDALAVLEAGVRVDVVFSDLVMPGAMDGVDLARTIRERWPWTAVVLATGYSEAVAEADREGFAVLRKPYVPDALEAAIQQAAARTSEMANVVPLRASAPAGAAQG